jgi:3-methyladenine DNA glycosylase Tag
MLRVAGTLPPTHRFFAAYGAWTAKGAPRVWDTHEVSPQAKGPQRIEPSGLADYLEVITKAVFQSGMSWRVVEAKWDGFRAAFHDFDPEWVAALTPPDVDRLAEDTRIIRNRRKIEATVHNAEELVELDRQHGSFRDYLRSHGSFEATVADLRSRLKFVGDTGAYYFLYVVGEDVPPHQEFMHSRGKG